MEKIYTTRTGFKVFCWIMAVICAVFVVLLPGTVLMLWIAYKAEVRMTDDKLYVRWVGRREIPWNDIAGIEWARAAGAIGGAMMPVSYRLHSKPKSHGNIAVGTFKNTEEIVAELERRTNLKMGRA